MQYCKIYNIEQLLRKKIIIKKVNELFMDGEVTKRISKKLIATITFDKDINKIKEQLPAPSYNQGNSVSRRSKNEIINFLTKIDNKIK